MVHSKSKIRLTFIFCALLPSLALAQAEKLFTPIENKALSASTSNKIAEIKDRNKSKTSGLYKFKISSFEAKSFALSLPDGRTVTMRRIFLTKNPTHLAYAASSEEEQVHLSLVTSGTKVSGTLQTQFANYKVDSVGEDDIYLFSAIDPSVAPQGGHGARVFAPPLLEQREREYQDGKKSQQIDPSGTIQQPSSSAPPRMSATATGPVIIDLMVQYTASARSYAGGNDQTIATDIRAAVSKANTTFANSGINVQINLVDLGASLFNDAGMTIGQVLQGWANRSDVSLRRNQVAADAVMVVASSIGEGCGETFTNRTITPQPGNAYSALNIVCLKGSDLTLVHELGHVFAADHNIGASQAPVIATGSAHGWPGTNDPNFTKVWNGSTWYSCQHTIMAYPTTSPGCTTSRMPYWSDPAKSLLWYYNGTTMQSYWYIGSQVANNKAQIAFAAPIVSAFRGPAGGGSGNGNGSEGSSTQSVFTMISRLLGGW